MQGGSQQFTGAPVSFVERVRTWFTPVGRPMLDGGRLAALNIVVMLGAFLLLAIMTLIDRIAGWLIPLPLVLPGFLVLLIVAAACLWIDWRYAGAYRRTSRRLGIAPQMDTFGIIASSPFIVIAVVLIGTGIFSLMLSVLTLSGSRFLDALGQVGYGVVFGALVGGIIYVTRLESEEVDT